MSLTYTNNAQSTLDAPIGVTDTVLTLPDGKGNVFPLIEDEDSGDWFPLTVIRADGTGYEVMHATKRTGDTVTVSRKQENTPTAISFSVGDVVSLRMTEEAYDEFAKQGDSTALIIKGLNIGEQTNAISKPYIVSLPGVTELVDGLRVSFKPTVENDDLYPEIQVNDLEAKRIEVTYTTSVGVAIGDITTDRLFDFQYSASLDRWIMDTTIPSAVKAGNLTVGGVVLALHNTAIFSEENPEALVDGSAVYDRKGISAIILDREQAPKLSEQWRSYGEGIANIVHTSVSGTYVNGGYNEYNTFKVSNGEEMQTGDVTIIKCAEEITIAGDVIFGSQRESVWPLKHFGPQGAVEVVGGEYGQATPFTGDQPDYVPRQWRESFVSRGITYGAPLCQFHGGHGRGAISRDMTDRYVRGRAGLILMAPKIRVLSTAKFYLPCRLSENGDNTVVTNTTVAGAGVLIFNTEDLVIDDAAQFKLNDPTADYERYDDLAADTSPGDGYQGAEGAKVYQANRSAGTVVRLIG